MMLTNICFLFILILCHCLIRSSNGEEYDLKLEEYNNFKGKDFCAKKNINILKKLCAEIGAKFYDIKEHEKIELEDDENCFETIISVSSVNDEEVAIKEKLLYCKRTYEQNKKIKALGRGRETYDAMEYDIIEGKAEPIQNRNDLLKEISDSFIYSQKSFAITFEEHENLEGKDFCTIRNPNVFQKLCVKVAALHKIRDYLIDFITFERCWYRNLSLFSMNEGQDVSTTENILYCGYNRKESDFGVVQFMTIALGRGINENDVMEYNVSRKDRKDILVPYKNRISLLDEALSLEDYKIIKGTNFCSTKKVDYFKNLCKKLAEFREITGQLKVSVSRQCLTQKVTLFSTAKQDDETITENLLICKYNKMAKMLKDEYDINNQADEIDYSELVALGRGKNEHDIMEYKLYKKNTYMPYENLIGFLKKVET